MSHALIIARRELRERSFVFIPAVIFAIAPFLAAVLPVGRRLGPATMIAGAASVIAPLLTLGLAVILGASIVGRELSERRMSFYFARPVSPSAIWFGKVMAALVLVACTFAITLLPALAFTHRDWNRSVMIGAPELIAATLAGAVILFLIAHFVSVIVRSRSPLAIVDLLLAVAAVLIAALIVRPLFTNFAVVLGAWTIGYLVISLCVTILVAGAWQLSRGRTDPRANHRELSRATWVLLGAFLTAGAAFVAWVLFATPSDLTTVFAYQAPGGEWVLARGEARLRGDFQPVFLMNQKSGQWIRFPEARWYGAAFTRTGSAALAVQPLDKPMSPRGELVIQKLDGDRAHIATGIAAAPWSNVMPSDDLTLLAVQTNQTLAIHDIGSHALLASVRLPFDPQSSAPQMFFADRDTLRVFMRERGKVHLYELDIPRKRLTKTGEISSATQNWISLRASADGSTLLVRPVHSNNAKILIADGRTGQIRRTLDTTDPRSYTFLDDGRIAGIDIVGSNSLLRLYSGDGTPQRDIPLGNVTRGVIIDIGRRDKVVVSLGRGKLSDDRTNLAVVDIERGVIEREMRFARYDSAFHSLDPRKPEPVRSGELVIGATGGRRVWRWNALTGEKTKLLGN